MYIVIFYFFLILLTGMGGFEPTNGGVKVRCLTTWRHPNNNMIVLITYVLSITLFKDLYNFLILF